MFRLVATRCTDVSFAYILKRRARAPHMRTRGADNACRECAYSEEKWMHADLFLPLRRQAGIMSASWIKRANTRIDFPRHRSRVVASSGKYGGGTARSDTSCLLFSVAVTEATARRTLRWCSANDESLIYIVSFIANYFRISEAIRCRGRKTRISH